MRATRPQSLIAVLLAVLYGLVGLTGESLHYLVTDPAALWASSSSAEPAGYFHTHAPDNHGHFHRHAHHGQHAHVAIVDVRHAGQAEQSAAVSPKRTSHKPHACPILTLVSTLKLGHADGSAIAIHFDNLITPTWQSAAFQTFRLAVYSHARAPPCDSRVA
jgi:hypothetical protein